MIYLDNNTLQQEVFIPRQNVRNDASPEYATKTELENAIENEVQRADDKYAAKTDLLPYATTGWVESQGFATEEWVEEQIQSAITSETARTEETYQRIDAMSAYSTTNEVEGMIDDAVSGKMDTSAMSAYSTTEQVEGMITAATDDMATQTWVNNQGFLTEHQSLSAYSTTEQMNTAINNATSGKVDTSAMSAYTKTEDFATINGSAITQGGNIEIQGGNYSAGTNIDITDGVISVTGITIPTSNTAFTNDAGYITANDIPTSNTAFTNDAGYITTADTQDFVTSGDVATQIEGYNYVNSGDVQSQINDSISGKVDTSAMTAYATNEHLDEVEEVTAEALNNLQVNKVDTSAMTQYYTSAKTDTAIDNAVSGKVDTSRVDEIEEVTASALTELKTTKQDTLVSGTNIKTINNESILGSGNIVISGGTAYQAGDNIQIQNNTISVTGITSYTGITSGDVTTALGFTPISSTDFESSDRAVSEAINDLNSKKVASNDVRDIVKMTQVQYDAISGSASPTTLYIITD